ncbi:MAG TPA: YceI family protein [Bacteroidota bacterium]
MKIAPFLWMLLIATAGTASAQSTIAETLKGESWMSYRMVHPLHTFDAKSTSVEYKLDIDPSAKEIKTVAAQVDVTTFDSGNSNRDSHAMEVIDAITYPDVTFTSTGVTQRGDSVSVAGKLTFHGITNDIVVAAKPVWSANRLDVDGNFDLSLTAFKIERPSLLMMPVQDNVRFTFHAAFAWK